MSGNHENSTNWKKILFCNELKHVNFYVGKFLSRVAHDLNNMTFNACIYSIMDN